MVVSGTIRGGVVVLEDSVDLPEGQPVKVVIHQLEERGSHSILDAPPMSLDPKAGAFDRTDLLEEMLDGRL